MPTIQIVIPGIPHAQKRHRSRVVNTPGRSFVQTYKSADQRVAEKTFRSWLFKSKPEKLIVGPVSLSFTCYFPIPKSWPKKLQERKLTIENMQHTSRPDLDNLEKHIMDCMTGVFWVDDRQVFRVEKEKFYDREPRTEIEVWFME